MWANMVAAYDNLPEDVKSEIADLWASHSFLDTMNAMIPKEEHAALRAKWPAVEHPVVQTHPETDEKILVLGAWATHFVNYHKPGRVRYGQDATQANGALFQYLMSQAHIPEFHVRWRRQIRALADAELDADIRRTLRSVYHLISGDALGEERCRLFIAEGEIFLDTVFDPAELPSWLPDVAIDYYVSEYTRRGFAGPLGHYRARDRNWEQSAFLDGLKLRQPAIFIGGAVDPAAEFFIPNYDRLEQHLPNLRTKGLLEGVGHSAAEERPQVVNEMLLAFLAADTVR